MKVIREEKQTSKCAMALGNFDGIHMAHTEIINRCVEYAKKNEIDSSVLLFERHTDTLCKNEDITLLTTLEEKLYLLEKTGVDCVFLKAFDESVMKMEPEEFFGYLTDKLCVSAIFAGYDYTFGHKAKGNVESLLELSEKNGTDVLICDKISIEKELVSSTKIRKFIENGEIDKANLHLGRKYFIIGAVEHGKRNGTKMGVPTANIKIPPKKLIPGDGVYSGTITVDKKEYKCLINIGKNPTFDAKKRTVEVHIPDFCEDIYEKNVIVEFDKKIRDEKKFELITELVKQIKKDLEEL